MSFLSEEAQLLDTRQVTTDELDVVYFFAGAVLPDEGRRLQTGIFLEDTELTCYLRDRITGETAFLPITSIEEGMDVILTWIHCH